MPIDLPITTTTVLFEPQTQAAIAALFSASEQHKLNQPFVRRKYYHGVQEDRRFHRLEFTHERFQAETVHLARAMAVDETLQTAICREIKRMTKLQETTGLTEILFFADAVGIFRGGILRHGEEGCPRRIKASVSLMMARAETPAAAVARHDLFKAMLWAWSDYLLEQHSAFAFLKQPTVHSLLET